MEGVCGSGNQSFPPSTNIEGHLLVCTGNDLSHSSRLTVRVTVHLLTIHCLENLDSWKPSMTYGPDTFSHKVPLCFMHFLCIYGTYFKKEKQIQSDFDCCPVKTVVYFAPLWSHYSQAAFNFCQLLLWEFLSHYFGLILQSLSKSI